MTLPSDKLAFLDQTQTNPLDDDTFLDTIDRRDDGPRPLILITRPTQVSPLILRTLHLLRNSIDERATNSPRFYFASEASRNYSRLRRVRFCWPTLLLATFASLNPITEIENAGRAVFRSLALRHDELTRTSS